MTGINEQFSDNPQHNMYGVITGSAATIAFPSESAKLLRFKADPANAGVFKIGEVGANDPTWPMSAGDDTGWIAPPSAEGNLRGLGDYCGSAASGSSDYLHWWIQR